VRRLNGVVAAGQAVVAERLNITDAAIDARLRELQRLVPEMVWAVPPC
jgi:hypothetical protein